jgi:hypothetical protein
MNALATSSFGKTLLGTGLVAGSMDATAASLQYYLRTGKSPGGVWRYVAGALMGPSASTGGGGTIAIGLLMHYGIAFGWTLLFFLAASRISALRVNPFILGPLYGIFVWAMMTRVLVPLTYIGAPKSFDVTQSVIAAAIIVVCIGMPIALGARRLWQV